MSQKNKQSVSEIIEKILKEHPDIERKLVARLIRAENPEYKTPSGRRKLDRKLEKLFSKPKTTIHFKKQKSEPSGIAEPFSGIEVKTEYVRDNESEQ